MLRRFAKLLANLFNPGEMDLETNDILGLTRQREFAAREISFTKIKEGTIVNSKFLGYNLPSRKSVNISSGLVVFGPYIENSNETAWAAVDVLAGNGKLYYAVPISEIILNDSE